MPTLGPALLPAAVAVEVVGTAEQEPASVAPFAETAAVEPTAVAAATETVGVEE